MQMMNRAIEDVSDFRDMMRKLQASEDSLKEEVQRHRDPQKPPKRPGENREQYRARIRSMGAKA